MLRWEGVKKLEEDTLDFHAQSMIEGMIVALEKCGFIRRRAPAPLTDREDLERLESAVREFQRSKPAVPEAPDEGESLGDGLTRAAQAAPEPAKERGS
jgi:hypothetical protein